jgi:hypothetical protein
VHFCVATIFPQRLAGNVALLSRRVALHVLSWFARGQNSGAFLTFAKRAVGVRRLALRLIGAFGLPVCGCGGSMGGMEMGGDEEGDEKKKTRNKYWGSLEENDKSTNRSTHIIPYPTSNYRHHYRYHHHYLP